MYDENYEIDELLKVKDLRKTGVFVFFMSDQRKFEWAESKYFAGDRSDKSRMKNLINEVINMACNNYSYGTDIILESVNNNLVSINKFEWVKEDSIASAYCWAMLSNIESVMPLTNRYAAVIQQAGVAMSTANICPDNIRFRLLSASQQISYIKDKLNIKENHVSTDEMYRDFQTVFDHMNLKVGEKDHVMNMLKEKWIESGVVVKDIKWLSKDDDACNWAWNYICNYSIDNIKIIIWPLRLFNPESAGDKYICFHAALRTWSNSPGEKKYFLYSLKKAWQQKIYREKQENKKILSCSLDAEVKNHLEQLAEAYDMTIVDLVTRLIENEYNIQNK